ncbi:tRNA lysidine(34) synthetase TilS [Anaerosalibacter massiliensis]|uniref:tRNA(Ile)-lysidine synthase n=1 Tax=Anaerosalibacter massiliensis TaxID=1347392 RepID=A0A9X2S4W3_9FIRM|nr:tRNA lysidine(34) synthetase TilS [Anaerosalibacter massiliensis]MCR2043903.1 tRNA lysidine(34) synthetase TilS [Anaerosalibacter massiliensis]
MELKGIMLSTITEHSLIEERDNILIGLSGGPDSMALLYALLEIKEKIPFLIYIAHVNHGVRGKDADEDEKFVEELSKDLNIPYYSTKIDMEGYAKLHKMSSEDAGRKLRYGFFREVLSKIGGGKIAVAHNKNDQAETLIMRFLRGTGIDGLGGMEYKSGNIIRPLLDISRDEIENYIEKNRIKTRLDKTNLIPIYNRNKIRLEAIPYIEKNFNPNIIDTLWRTSNIMSEDSNFLNKYSLNKYKEYMKIKKKDSIILDRNEFIKEDDAIKKRIIRHSINDLTGSLKGITSKHILDIVELFDKGETGKSINLINNIVAETSYDDIVIRLGNSEDRISYNYNISLGKPIYIEETNFFIEAKILPRSEAEINFKDRFIKYFDYDKIEGGLCVRNRLRGDKFIPLGMNGMKKVKDLFIDEKVPLNKRETIPIVTDDKNIIWVVGFRISEKHKITSSTKNVLIIKYVKA